MTRLTKKDAAGGYVLPTSDINQAVERLARFENLLEDLTSQQTSIPEELEQLRQSGKTKTVRFRELMGQKLFNSGVLDLFERYGLK